MSDNPINKPASRHSLLQHVHLKQMVFLFPVLLSIFCLVSETTYAQQKRIIKQDLFSASFPTEKEGWASGRWGTVLHTEDGGQTWFRQDTGTDYDLSAICFSDPQNGWAVGEKGTIIHTRDGGRSWVKQKSPVEYFLFGVCFVSDQKGWIATEWSTILHTEDGGKSWQVQFSDADFFFKSISFCDPLTGWVAGEYGFIYHTADGGRTWEHQDGFYKYSDETFSILSGNTLFDVVAIDSMRAWVVGIDGYIARTLDGGATWERVSSDITKAPLFGISSDRQGNTILIGGKGMMLTSSDGGKHFGVPKVEPSVIYGWIYGITPMGSRGFVAVGKESWIYLGNSKGSSWQRSGIGSGH